jgi:hypothetical protein
MISFIFTVPSANSAIPAQDNGKLVSKPGIEAMIA